MTHAPCKLETTYRYICGMPVCETNVSVLWRHSLHEQITLPYLPMGWTVVGHVAVCEKHEVKVDEHILHSKQI